MQAVGPVTIEAALIPYPEGEVLPFKSEVLLRGREPRKASVVFGLGLFRIESVSILEKGL